eukprot:9487717-Pyramimonas_sp.AAC.2
MASNDAYMRYYNESGRGVPSPTRPLGVGVLGSVLFHPSFFPFGEGFTPPPASPGPGEGVPRGVEEATIIGCTRVLVPFWHLGGRGAN